MKVTFTDDAANQESLTSAATTAVAAQPAETPVDLLTASFANVPADHNGSNFTFQLNFSENVDAGYARIQDHAFTVTGGSIASASRTTQGSNQGWNVEVNPTGNGSVTITLPETTDCSDSGAICTGNERMLSHATSVTVAGPPAISVSDATVEEAEGAVLNFSVTLSHPSTRTVTVDYETSDGTAVAGSDYTAASGALTFNAGDLSQTVQVTVLTDSEDEGQETLTMTLSNPSQATLDDATGAGAIENGDSSSSTVVNSPPNGLPTVSGTPQVDQTLTADTSPINDQDGLTNVSYRYQWIAGGSDIYGATGSSYELTHSEQGQTIQVRVTFTDDADNQESLTSVATVAVAAAPNREATGKPTISGTPQVDQRLTVDTTAIEDANGLTNVSYQYQWLAGGLDINGATASSHLLTTSEQGQTVQVKVTFTDDADNQESLTSAATLAVAAKPNTAATGEPTISGTPQVRETLTADTSGISDDDRLTNVSYQYQWLRDDAEIAGQTNSTYELVSADEGKTIKVRVTFNDDAGNAESLTSAATTAVAAQPTPAVVLTASFGNMPADHNGDNFTFQLTFSENVEAGYARIRDHAFTADGATIANAYRQTQGSNQGWNVEVNPTGNGAVSITLPETTDCSDSGAICTEDSRKLSHPTSATVAGPPAISVSDATVQEAEGAVLAFSATLSHAYSRTITVDYATSDGTAQAGSDYTEASGALTFNAGDTSQTVQVTVLTDSEDEGEETLTLTISNPSQATLGDATATGTIEDGEPSSGTQEDPPAETPVVLLTASFANVPATHNGSNFTFDLTFSENVKAGYARIRDHAFTVSGGAIASARRKTQGSNQGWTVEVDPTGNGAVSITLPETTDCDDNRAICTEDGRMLSNRLEVTVSGPGG